MAKTARLYHWASCSTCREAREALVEAGIRPELRDFFAQPLSAAELRELAGLAGGARHLFSFQSPSFRKLGRPQDSFAEEELLELMGAEPRFVRRPLLVSGKRIAIGVPAIKATLQGARQTG